MRTSNYFSRARNTALWITAALCLAACRHDLDALKEGDPNAEPGGGAGATAGTSGADSSVAGTAGSDADAGGMGGSSADAGPDGSAGTTAETCDCVAPDPVKIGAVDIAPEACCYGPLHKLCGIKFDKADTCHPPTIAGELDSTCDGAKGNIASPGCCRADSQCGAMISAFDLGCVAFENVPKALGGPTASLTCTPSCTADSDCTSFDKTLVCVEDKTHVATARHCATSCERDPDCVDNPRGSRCVLLANRHEDTLDSMCEEKIGPLADGQPCASNEECVHGMCVQNSKTLVKYCTRLCAAGLDCEADQECRSLGAQTPSGTSMQTVRLCLDK